MENTKRNQIPGNRMPPPARTVQPGVAVGLTPKEIVGILRRHILLIVSMTVLGFMVGGTGWYFLRKYFPKYTAQTLIKVLPPIEKDPMTIEARQVGKELQYGHRVSMAERIKQQSSWQKLIARDKIQKTNWFQRFGKIKDERIAKAVKDLRKHFSVHPQRDSDFIIASMTCGNRVEAQTIVNEMVDLFLASQGSTKREEVTDKLARLEERRVSIQNELTSAESALDYVRDRYGFTDLEERQFRHTITAKLDDLELEQNQLVLEITQIQANVETLEKQAVGPINKQVEHQIETDPIMVMLAQQMALQEAQLAGLLTKFGENHKEVRHIRELISKSRQQRQIRKTEIAEQTRQSNLQNAQDVLVISLSRLEELNKRLQDAATEKRDLDLARVQYDQRVAIRDERRRMLDDVKLQIDKLKMVHDDPETPKVQFAGYAPVPLEISSPRWQLYFPGGTALGFMFGMGLTFLIELLNDLVRTPRDVVRFLHIPLLGVIPDAQEDPQTSKRSGVNLHLLVNQAPYSVISESYRRLRANLKLSSIGQSAKTLLVSSGSAGEGKTSVAINLATTFVAEEKKVLLIDANFRRASLHTLFPQNSQEQQADDESAKKSDFGLSTMLAGLCGYQEIVRSTDINGLDVITAGPLPFNPTELLSGQRMEQLIKRQREEYDYVIVDGPPVLLVSDAKMLARFVDGTILVFNAAATRKGAAQRTIRELREVNASIVGCVLFAVKALKGGYFAEQFRSYREYQQLQLAANAV